MTEDQRRSAPATLRNREPILDVLRHSTCPDGDTTPTRTDSTDFGATKKGKTITKKFTVAADLWESQVTVPSFTDQTHPVHVTGAVPSLPDPSAQRSAKMSTQVAAPPAAPRTPGPRRGGLNARHGVWSIWLIGPTIVLLAIVVLNFFLIRLAPGDPAVVMAGEAGASDQVFVKQLREKFGLDKPLPEQLLIYVKGVVSLDLGSSAAESIIPVEIDLADSLERLMPALKGRIAAVSTRVPVANGAMADFTVQLSTVTTPAAINELFRDASAQKYKGILEYTEEPLVSLDIKGNTHSVVIDGTLTSVVGRQVKLIAWFDNEYGYTSRMIDWIYYWKNLLV